jgi:diamine N-acetyltransferase
MASIGKITLKPITEKTFEPIIALDAGDDGTYVENNSITIIQALFKKLLMNVKGIYLGSGKDAQPIGLILVHPFKNNKLLSIHRFMIDKAHQGKGYGKEAFKLGLKFYIKKYKPTTVELSSKNANAIKLYKQFGFFEYRERKGEKAYLRAHAKDILYP